MSLRLIRVHDVIHKTGLSRPTIYRKERSGEFPKRKQIGANSVAWVESEVDSWIEKMMAEPVCIKAVANKNSNCGEHND